MLLWAGPCCRHRQTEAFDWLGPRAEVLLTSQLWGKQNNCDWWVLKLVSSLLWPVSDTTTVFKIIMLLNYAFRRWFKYCVGCVWDDSEQLSSRVYCYVTWSRQLCPLLLFTCADALQRRKLSPYLYWRYSRRFFFLPLLTLHRSAKLTFNIAAIQFDVPCFDNISILYSFVHS